MFAWETRGKKVFKNLSQNYFSQTKELVANQGLYNGFLAIKFDLDFFFIDDIWRMNIALFFLSCVTFSDIYSVITTEKKIFFVKGLSDLVTIALIVFSN